MLRLHLPPLSNAVAVRVIGPARGAAKACEAQRRRDASMYRSAQKRLHPHAQRDRIREFTNKYTNKKQSQSAYIDLLLIFSTHLHSQIEGIAAHGQKSIAPPALGSPAAPARCSWRWRRRRASGCPSGRDPRSARAARCSWRWRRSRCAARPSLYAARPRSRWRSCSSSRSWPAWSWPASRDADTARISDA